MALKSIVLTAEQRAVVNLPARNPILIKGVAGSGKTTVAIYRAKYLLETHSTLFKEAKVAIFAYNKVLVKYIRSLVSEMELNISVFNFHRWAFEFMLENGIDIMNEEDNPDGTVNIATGHEQDKAIDAAINEIYDDDDDYDFSSYKRIQKRKSFYKEEFAWIKGKAIYNLQEYLDTKRTGRGTKDRVTQTDKELLWAAYKAYNKYLQKHDLIDFDDFALKCLELLTENPPKEKPFTHIVIDEAQDLSKAAVLVISKLVGEETQSITLIADVAQRIFRSDFTWREAGLNILGGRTVELKRSYRCPEPIARAAMSLLDHEDDKTDLTLPEVGRLGGFIPALGIFDGQGEHDEYIVEQLKKLKAANHLAGTVVLHRTWKGVQNLESLIAKNGFYVKQLKDTEEVDFAGDTVLVCTLSSIKGLEFTNVFVANIDDSVMPSLFGYSEESRDEHISRERRLLFTAMTRASERLWLLSSGRPSIFLSEIDSNYVNDFRSANEASNILQLLARAQRIGVILADIFEAHPNALEDVFELRRLMADMFPSEKLRVGAIVAIFELGFVSEMKTIVKLNATIAERMILRVIADYGVPEDTASEALYSWAFFLDVMGGYATVLTGDKATLAVLSEQGGGVDVDIIVSDGVSSLDAALKLLKRHYESKPANREDVCWFIERVQNYMRGNAIAREYVAKRFPPPQMTYERFIDELDSMEEAFVALVCKGSDLISLSLTKSDKRDWLLAKYKCGADTFCEKLEDLSIELVDGYSPEDSASLSGRHIDDVLLDIEVLINSVKDYE